MNNILERFIEKLKGQEEIEAVILFGSHARGNNRADSDIDLIVIREGQTIRTTEQFESTTIEITYISLNATKKYWNNNKNNCAELWGYAMVVYDRNGLGRKLETHGRAIRDAGTNKLDTIQIGHFKFDFEDQIKSITHFIKTDILTAELIINKKVLDSLHLFFVLRNEWVPAPKQQMSEIKGKDQRMFDLVSKYYNTIDLQHRIRVLTEIKSHLFD